MKIGPILRQARKNKKLSQMEIARRSHISVATIQNIEAGRANPEWDTLTALLKTLSLKIEITTPFLDWSLLVSLGCPLLTDDSTDSVSSLDLLELLATTDFSQHERGMDERQSLALTAWLCALRDHYPSLWNQTHIMTRTWFESMPPANIKLRRLALSRMANYL